MNPTPTQIKSARTTAGLTQAEAAKLCHVTLAGYQHWEYGVRKMSESSWELFLLKLLGQTSSSNPGESDTSA